ncbi:Piwi-like protein 2 [Halocaridina rubra]|uniref:Piwi-like protein 2 n=1 Tax=Halocaridina rubra TaxID=373956 RepID=A0AAN8WLQ7_HALRR
MEDKDQPQPAGGRGGRGALILQAIQKATRQPGQTMDLPSPLSSVLPSPIKPPSEANIQRLLAKDNSEGIRTSLCRKLNRSVEQVLKDAPIVPVGADVGATALKQLPKLTILQERCYDTNKSLSVPSCERIDCIAKSLLKGTHSSHEGAVGCTTTVRELPHIGRGRSDLIRALKVKTRTNSPVADSAWSTYRSRRFEDDSSLVDAVQKLKVSPDEKPVISKQGTSGSKFAGSTNWIYLSQDPNRAVFEYEVKFDPEIDATNVRFRLLNSVRENIGSTKSFDGSILWLPTELPNKVTILSAVHLFTNEPVAIKIIFKCKKSMDQCLQLYNVLFGRIMKILKMVKMGNNYYSPNDFSLVPQHKLEIWPGFITAVHHMEGGLMMMIDISHRVLRTETCYDIMGNIYRSQRGNFKDAVNKEFLGAIVLTRYNNKTYRIDDILFEQNASSTFTNDKGEEISYINYYKNTYDIDIKDPKQPLLLHRITKKGLRDRGVVKAVSLIPELCYVTGLRDDMRADFRVMKDIAQFTRVTPDVRQAALRTFIRNVNENSMTRQTLADWGLTLEDSTIHLEGRVLPPETIYFKNKEMAGTDIADFSREVCRENVIVPIDLKPQCWMVMFFKRDEERAIKFVEMLRQVTRCLGIQVGDPRIVRLFDDKTQSYVNGLKQHYHDQLQIAVIIFPTQRDDRYAAVKRTACIDLCLPTQCINSRTLSQDAKLRSVTQKIALQMNCKMGGELWALKIPISGLMVCGIDVYHDPVHKGASVVGFVASFNNTLTRWFSRSSFQHPSEEIISGLKISLLEALRHYHKLHHSLPRTIIVYRDGVSDGQLQLVEDHEVPQLSSIFQHFESYEPKLSFIVVQKKTHTRIFSLMRDRRYNNPLPGSIVDSIVTRRNWCDFLLVSQHVRQGTVSPSHYIIIRDAGNLKVDNIQKLTYKLTHLYYNWPGTVRVPAPCQSTHSDPACYPSPELLTDSASFLSDVECERL